MSDPSPAPRASTRTLAIVGFAAGVLTVIAYLFLRG
jgi:hypothetical protein